MSEERTQQEEQPRDSEPQPQEQPPEAPPPQPPPPEPPQPAAAEEKPDWRDRRIGEQQQRLRERNARIAELEAQLAQHNQTQPGNQFNQQAQPAQQPTGDIQRQINEAAQQMAAQQEFTRRCNDVAEAGRRAYQNFDNRVQRLTGIVDANDPQQVQQYNAFLQAAMETGQASRIIYELGGDLNEASRIMAMTPVRMAVELTKMSVRPGSEASQAPRPLNPVATVGQNNRVSVQPDDPDSADTLSMEEWMRRREEQITTRRNTRTG